MAQSYHADGGTSTRTPDTSTRTPDKSTRTYTFTQKWGDDPFTALGYTQAPNALIAHAARLGLTPEECWLIVCILRFKHTPDDPYPSQETLAALFGQSERTIRRLVERIERRGLVLIERVRGDHGHYTHSVYDFTPLRAALNACYYEDHPQERPQVKPRTPGRAASGQKRPVVATGQNCPVDGRTVLAKPPDRIDQTTGQNCPPNQSLEKKIEEEASAPPALPERDAERPEAARAGTPSAFARDYFAKFGKWPSGMGPG